VGLRVCVVGDILLDVVVRLDGLIQPDTDTCGHAAPTSRAMVPIGRWIADSPMCYGVPGPGPSAARASARSDPRLLPATSWISSTITTWTPWSIARLRSAVTSRERESGW
jgi:hypothetical protein